MSPQKGCQSPGHNPLSRKSWSGLDIISVCSSIPIEIPILWPRAVMVGPRPHVLLTPPLLTAPTPLLKAALHRLISPLHILCSSAVTVSLHCVHAHHSAVHNAQPHCNTAVRLNACLMCPLCVSQLFDSVAVSVMEACCTLSVSLKGTGVPAALTLEVLWVTTLLGAVALC
jgi:hypothetical protein